MILTNKNNYPEALYLAVKNDPYTKGASDFSVTELLAPPRQRVLRSLHEHELEEDVEDRLWSLYGQVAHGIVERSNVNEITEVRYFGKFGDHVVSAQIDNLCLHKGVLSDYKFTSAGQFMDFSQTKADWIGQLNMQLELLRMNGLDARTLRIVGLLRDYNLNALDPEHKDYEAYYPKHPIQKRTIPMWTREFAQGFIQKRIDLHVKARQKLPKCTVGEHWSTRRCKKYCNVVKFCTQAQEMLNKQLNKE